MTGRRTNLIALTGFGLVAVLATGCRGDDGDADRLNTVDSTEQSGTRSGPTDRTDLPSNDPPVTTTDAGDEQVAVQDGGSNDNNSTGQEGGSHDHQQQRRPTDGGTTNNTAANQRHHHHHQQQQQQQHRPTGRRLTTTAPPPPTPAKTAAATPSTACSGDLTARRSRRSTARGRHQAGELQCALSDQAPDDPFWNLAGQICRALSGRDDWPTVDSVPSPPGSDSPYHDCLDGELRDLLERALAWHAENPGERPTLSLLRDERALTVPAFAPRRQADDRTTTLPSAATFRRRGSGSR